MRTFCIRSYKIVVGCYTLFTSSVITVELLTYHLSKSVCYTWKEVIVRPQALKKFGAYMYKLLQHTRYEVKARPLTLPLYHIVIQVSAEKNKVYKKEMHYKLVHWINYIMAKPTSEQVSFKSIKVIFSMKKLSVHHSSPPVHYSNRRLPYISRVD